MRWEERHDAVWLLADADGTTGVEDVVRECDAAGYDDLDVDAVERVLRSGTPEAVARIDARRRRGAVEVLVDPDGRTATLHLRPPGDLAPALTRDDVAAGLARAGVKLGIDHLLLDSLPLTVAGEYLVATGWDPVAGGDGKVEYLVDPVHEFRPEPRCDGGVDFRAVATIPDVEEGQLLAALVDPEPGTPGRTVLGEAIPAPPGAPAELPTGENVTVSEDGHRLHAATDGLFELVAGRISVRPEFVIDGDVGLERGSVSFSGDVIVHGSVRPGFSVEAKGRVVVMGDVEEAQVTGGTLVWVRGAVVGVSSVVHSGGDAKVRTVHHGRIEARRNLYIEREAHEATLLAGSDLVLESRRNRISGGTARAGHQILAGEIGAVGGATTRLHVGADPFVAELLESLRDEAAAHRRDLERVDAAIKPFVGRPDAVAALPPDRRRPVERLVSVAASLRAQIVELELRMDGLRADRDDTRSRIAARMAMRPGAVLGVCGSPYTVRTTQHRVAATCIDGRVTLVPLGSERVPRGPVPDGA